MQPRPLGRSQRFSQWAFIKLVTSDPNTVLIFKHSEILNKEMENVVINSPLCKKVIVRVGLYYSTVSLGKFGKSLIAVPVIRILNVSRAEVLDYCGWTTK